MTPEGKVQRAIKKQALLSGYWVLRLSIIGMSGFPDLMLVGHGTVGFIEVKKKGSKPGPLQLKRIEQLRSHGLKATWCDNVEEAEKFINDLKPK